MLQRTGVIIGRDARSNPALSARCLGGKAERKAGDVKRLRTRSRVSLLVRTKEVERSDSFVENDAIRIRRGRGRMKGCICVVDVVVIHNFVIIVDTKRRVRIERAQKCLLSRLVNNSVG